MQHLLTLSDSVASHARLQPGKLAARDSRRALTFAQLDERASRLANALLASGLVKGDRVALLAHNCIEWMEIYVALARAGLVAVPINFRLLAAEIAYIVSHSGAAAVIAQQGLHERIVETRSQLGLPPDRTIHFGGPCPEGWQSYEERIESASAALPDVAVGPEDIFALMYTSGTTGHPKGVIRSHSGNALLALCTALEFGFSADDTALLVMPMCHANSLYFALTFASLGGTVVVDDRAHFDPEALLATLARERVTFTSLVPTHYIMMLGLPAATRVRYDVRSVEKLLISSAPARPETKRAILEYFSNSGLYELYGSTEAGWVTLLRPKEQAGRLGSVGREWAGSGAIRLLGPDRREVPDGEVGELYSRTPYVFDGYWQDAAKTAEAFHGPWCSVGDMGRRDADGYIHLVDRKSNMIISGGENVYPSEVEAVIGAHPKVKDVAVIGVAHAKWGEAVQAVIVLHEGEEASAAEIRDWCRQRMAGYKRPQGVQFISDADMPRTATGKILHRQLRDRFAAGTPVSPERPVD
ncbi:MAG: class I adenylate-forming enzyme family protein [Lautropia sp.]